LRYAGWLLAKVVKVLSMMTWVLVIDFDFLLMLNGACADLSALCASPLKFISDRDAGNLI